MGLTDTEIIQRIKKGEIDEFRLIVHKYTRPVVNFVRQRLKNTDDMEDIVQLSFVKFYKAINYFDTSRPILPYLLQIAKNELKMYYRSHKQTLQLDETILTEKEVSIDQTEDIHTLLNYLPHDQQKALNLLSDGYSYNEIAHKLGKPLNTIKTIIRRARLQLIKHKL